MPSSLDIDRRDNARDFWRHPEDQTLCYSILPKLTDRHADKSQLLLALRGASSCEAEGGLWMVPPRSAIWIPGGAIHAVKITGTLEGYAAFVAPELGEDLPATCCAVSVTPLLRELLIHRASLPLVYKERGVTARLMAVLLDDMASAGPENLHLPMPTDVRLRGSST